MLIDLDVTKFKVEEPLEGNELNRRLTQMVYELNEQFEEVESRLLPEIEAGDTYVDNSINSPFTIENENTTEQHLYNLVTQVMESEGVEANLPTGGVVGDILIWDGSAWVLIGNLSPGAAGELLVSTGSAWESSDEGFAHKVTGGVEGNFADLTADGDIGDSGISPSDIPYIPPCPVSGSHVLMCDAGVMEWVELETFTCPA